MTTSDSRERFEEWAKSSGFDVSPEIDGNYKARDTYHAWIAWKAAISAKAPSVAVGELEKLADSWVNGGWRTGADYVNALQECADQLRNLISKAGRDE